MTRKQYWIAPDFQRRMIRQWSVLVLLTSVGTHLITMGFIRYQDAKVPGAYYYVPNAENSSPVIVDPLVVKRMDIAFPSLLLALGLGIGISVLAGVFYSHRLAGPVFRMRRTLHEAIEGKSVKPILLRQNDEFKELADDLNRLLDRRALAG